MAYGGPERRRKLQEGQNQTDHDLLIRVDTKLDIALGRLNDFDRRITILEKGYWKVIGGAGAIVLLGDVIIKMLIK